jgi:hypothetical protein
MQEKRSKRYLQGIMWFTALWSVKEFILEPLIKKIKDEQKSSRQIKS